ncbi:MAG: hypothetical protein Q9218_008135 [Villophora microphyllina]
MSDNLSPQKQAATTKAKSPAAEVTRSTSTAPQLEADSNGDSEASTVKLTGKDLADATKEANEDDGADATDTPAATAGTEDKAKKSSPKKRAASKAPKDESPKKKRAPAKAKVTTEDKSGEEKGSSLVKKGRATKAGAPSPEPKFKSESEDTITGAADEDSASDVIPEPKTPKKGGRTAKAKTPAEPKTPKTPKAAKEPKSVERKRAASGKVADKVPLPTAWANASDADKMLVKMKEEGKSWSEIRDTWRTLTGQDTAGSTLPNRYLCTIYHATLLTFTAHHFFAHPLPFPPIPSYYYTTLLTPSLPSLPITTLIPHTINTTPQSTILAAAKAEIEANWKNSKWHSIATKMEEKGAKKYPVEFLQKEWKKLEVEAAAAAASSGGDGITDDNDGAAALLGAAIKATAGGDESEGGEEDGEQ